MASESGMLSESYLFKARSAPLLTFFEKSTGGVSSSSSSSRYYSARIRTLMKLKSERGMSEKDAEIEASKTHWTEVESNRYYTPHMSGRLESSTSESGGESCGVEMTEEERVELYKENLEEMRRLQIENGNSRFFRIGGEVVGKMIAKGGQATIYEHWGGRPDKLVPNVLKVFEAGYSVRELRKQWPLDLLQRYVPIMGETEMIMENLRNIIFGARLLDDGRFAFQMFRYWGDVRKLLDVRMECNGNRYPPFMMEDGTYDEHCIVKLWISIAMGMKGLHGQGILHGDLKASNMLIESAKFFDTFKEEDRLHPLELDDKFFCLVADYECSIGVVGTGFWRAPEILEALKNRTGDLSSNAFTQKADVYSYAMTCYEILTGFIPFEHPEDQGTNFDHVIDKRRPTLPQHLKPWAMNFFQNCWHPNPSERPTFTEIIEQFLSWVYGS